MSTPRNILIVRLSAIGDVVLTTPLIGALKRTWPEIRISWLVEESNASLLKYNPDLEEVILWPRQQWQKMWSDKKFRLLARSIWSFIRDLRQRQFDLVLDVQGLLKSGIWAYLSGAHERIGLGSKEGSRFLMTRYVDRSSESNRISSQYFLLAEEMGLDTSNFSMRLALDPEAVDYADGLISEIGSPYAVFAPFTTRPQKHWFEERWTELSNRAFQELGLKVVLLGSKGDVQAASRIVGDTVHTLDLSGKTSLQQAAAIIKRSSLLIGVDTGLTHMGYALDVPTIALFGATRPYLDVKDNPGKVIYHPYECSQCHRSPTCDGDFTCMKAISTEEVFQTARNLLSMR